MWDFISSQGGVATFSGLKSLPLILLKVSPAWMLQAEGSLATAWLTTQHDASHQGREQLHLQPGLTRPQGSCVLVSSSAKRAVGYKNVGSSSSPGNRGLRCFRATCMSLLLWVCKLGETTCGLKYICSSEREGSGPSEMTGRDHRGPKGRRDRKKSPREPSVMGHCPHPGSPQPSTGLMLQVQLWVSWQLLPLLSTPHLLFCPSPSSVPYSLMPTLNPQPKKPCQPVSFPSPSHTPQPGLSHGPVCSFLFQ